MTETIKTVKELAEMYGVHQGTIKLYTDGYKFSKYRKHYGSIIWNEDSKSILDEMILKVKTVRSHGVSNKERIEKLEQVVVSLHKEIEDLKKLIKGIENV